MKDFLYFLTLVLGYFKAMTPPPNDWGRDDFDSDNKIEA